MTDVPTFAFAERWEDFAGRPRALWTGLDHVAEVRASLDVPGTWLAVDIESAGLGDLKYQTRVVGMATTRYAIALDPRRPDHAAAIRELLAAAPILVFQNSPYDVPALYHHGLIDAAGIARIWDTLILGRLAWPDSFVDKSLAGLAKRFLGVTPGDPKLRFAAVGATTKNKYFEKADIDLVGYVRDNLLDACATAEMFPMVHGAALAHLTSGHPFDHYGVTGAEAERVIFREQVVNRVMLNRNARGFGLDRDHLAAYRAAHEIEVEARRDLLVDAGVKPGVGHTLIAHLESIDALPAGHPRTDGGKPSAAKKALEKLHHIPIVATYAAAQDDISVGKYLVQVEREAAVTGRIHPESSILGASATGRHSVSNPPLQQFSKDARGMILADEGDTMTSIDWSSVEPYVMACLSHDDALCSYYEGGGDIYAPIVETAGVTRDVAKVVVLAKLYGQGNASLAARLGVSSDTASSIQNRVMVAMPGIAAFIETIKRAARTHGKVVTVAGRILPVPRFDDGFAAYMAVNYTVQGSAADVMNEAIYAMWEHGLTDAMYLSMHDELVVSTEAAGDVRRLMETAPASLTRWAARPVKFRTDRADLGVRWGKPE